MITKLWNWLLGEPKEKSRAQQIYEMNLQCCREMMAENTGDEGYIAAVKAGYIGTHEKWRTENK